jgi:hypothetical protein
MYRIDNATVATTLPTPRIVGPNPNGFFTRGAPGVTAATIVDDDWLNAVQEEISHVVEAAGLTLDKTNPHQLTLAVEALIASAGGASFYDIEAGANGKITANQVLRIVAPVRTITIPAGCAGSFGYTPIPAAATTTIVINKNGSAVGTIVFGAGATNPTFTATSAIVLDPLTDILTIVAPATADASLASVMITLKATAT